MLHLRRALLRHVTTSSPPPPRLPTHSLYFLNAFSTRPAQKPDPAQLAHSLSAELLRDSTSLPHRLRSAFPTLSPSPTLIQSTLSLSAAADRRAILGFLTFLTTHHQTLPNADEILSLFVDHFGKLRDFKSTRDVILAGRRFAGAATAASNFAWMVRSGRIPEAVAFLDNMEKDFGLKFDGIVVKAAAEKLCENAFEAERTVIRLAREAASPRNVGTWNVVMSCLCKIRRPDMASSMLDRMGWGDKRVQPNETSYIVVIRGLYKAGRIEEGDAVMERMKGEKGLKVDSRVYYRVLKTLCNVGKFEHAVSVVKKMKEEGVEPGVKVYLLMMDKLGGDYRVDKKVKDSKPGELKLRPRLHKLHEPGKRREKPVKVTETISEKVKRKRRRIKQVRLMFVKKPIRGLHRPF